jgi:hypothetical protein
MIRIRPLPVLFVLLFVLHFISGAYCQSSVEDRPNAESEVEIQKRLAEIANSINELKERVYRSKAKLKLLEETLLLGKITGSKSLIKFKNNVGSIFKLTGGEYYLNGKLIHRFEREIPEGEHMVIFDGESPPGNNKITLKLTFTGSDKGSLKMFSYLKDYKFNLESNYDFPVSYGKTTLVTIESIDRGPFKNTLEERLSIRYKTLTEENASIPF